MESYSIWLFWWLDYFIPPWYLSGSSMLWCMSEIPSFQRLNNCPLCISMHHTLLIHSCVSEHVGCLLALALVNSAAVNMGVQIPLWDPAFNSSGYIPRSGIAHMVILFLIFWETAILFSTAAVSFYLPTSSVQEFQFLHILISTCYFLCVSVCIFWR